ncbi:hypothetical protein ISS06_00945 [Patescibacteria group bacterium]|nr:hypothetical protein [Patescibacteria group bacterium]
MQQQFRSWGFRQIGVKEFQQTFRRLRLRAPRSRPGREVGFVFAKNGLEVTAWTTWMMIEQKARESDAAWIVISKQDNALYFSHPIHRTKNFVVTFLRQAWIAMYKIKHRPICLQCNKFMNIAKSKGIKSRYWSCCNKSEHKDNQPVWLSWDYGLPPKALAYVKKNRKQRTKYRQQLAEQGKPQYQSLKKRKPWQKQTNTL